ncbi:hypothetical protein FB451DRAFT_1183336 [Mycena latifolia]|nr:hypothetical protein FB451DRAFT_1183336 [Mycena latifolia]
MYLDFCWVFHTVLVLEDDHFGNHVVRVPHGVALTLSVRVHESVGCWARYESVGVVEHDFDSHPVECPLLKHRLKEITHNISKVATNANWNTKQRHDLSFHFTEDSHQRLEEYIYIAFGINPFNEHTGHSLANAPKQCCVKLPQTFDALYSAARPESYCSISSASSMGIDAGTRGFEIRHEEDAMGMWYSRRIHRGVAIKIDTDGTGGGGDV